jgi:hypothetical protein
MSHTEEYRVRKSTLSCSPPSPLPTTQMTMDLVPTNNPPTKIPQIRISRTSSQSGRGSEVENRKTGATEYGSVNYKKELFDELKRHLQDSVCTVYLRYQSDVVSGNDPIDAFEPIYVFGGTHA